jgi:hypothetical protein
MAGNYLTVVDADSPIAHWRLNETSGTNAVDRKATIQNLTYAGGYTLNQNSAFVGEAAAKAVDLNGTTGYVAGPGTANVKLTTDLDADNNVSFEAWILPWVNNVEQMVACLRADGAGWRFGLTSAGKMLFHFGSSGGFQNGHAASTTTITTAGWHHIVVTYDGTTVRYYLDGQPDGTAAVTTNLAFTAGQVDLGRYGGFGGGFLFSRLQDVAVYTTTLSAARVLAHYEEARAVAHVTVSAPVADVTVAGLDPSLQLSTSLSTDTADISVAGLAPTLEMVIPVAVADVLVAGLDATVALDMVVSAAVADVAVEGFAPSVATGSTLTIAVDSTNISVAGLPPALAVATEATLADVVVAGLDAEVAAAGNIVVNAPSANVTVAGVVPALIYGGSTQFLRPDADIAVAWSRSTGNNQWSLLDEVVSNDDIDYIYLHYNGNYAPGGTYQAIVSLTNALDPIIHTGHTLRVRYKGSGLAVHIYQGTTWIYGWSLAGVATWTTNSLSLPTDAVAQITDYSDLRVALVAGFTYSLYASDIRVSWVELELPEGGLSHAQIDTSTANVSVAGMGAVFDDGATGAGVLAEVANILVSGLVPSFSVGEHAVVSVETADVVVQGPSPDVITPGSVSLGVDPGDVIVAGQQTELTTDRTVEFLAEVVDVVVGAGDPSVRTGPDQLSFRFVADTYTGLSALDAAAMNQLDFGPLLHGQTKTLRFRLGNDSPMTTHFLIQAVSENAGVADWVTFSPNNILYTPFIIVESVPGNGLTDVVWCRIHVATDAAVGVGNVLIEVEQIVA